MRKTGFETAEHLFIVVKTKARIDSPGYSELRQFGDVILGFGLDFFQGLGVCIRAVGSLAESAKVALPNTDICVVQMLVCNEIYSVTGPLFSSEISQLPDFTQVS